MGGVGLLAWIPPAAPVLVLAFICAVSALAAGDEVGSPRAHKAWVLVAALVVAIVAAVVTQWVRHPEGVRDWMHGGVTYIDRDDNSQLGWVDWALVVTRRGLIHSRAARLRLETRFFFGLVPVASHEIKLDASDRAEVTRRDHTAARHRGTSSDRGWWEPPPGHARRVRVHTDHIVELVSASGETVRLLDVSTRTEGEATRDFAESVARRINQRLEAIDWEGRQRKRPAPRRT
jgi:hypothetical protein